LVKIGIISDTHITGNENPRKNNIILEQVKQAFHDIDEMIHVGDIIHENFLNELKKIAPTKAVRGNLDEIGDLKRFITFNIGKYNIGVIHKLPDDVEDFCQKYQLQILIYGHTHIPVIKGTSFNTLLLNPGSPTKPKAPPKRPLFKAPIARPTVMTLEIDNDDILKTFIINLNIEK